MKNSPARDLRDQWEYLELRLVASPHVCLLSDFDGTLIPLGPRPDRLQREDEARTVLDGLRRNRRATVGVVSGRRLIDLAGLLRVPGIWYVGNHGFELRDPRGGEHRQYEPEDALYVGRVREELERETRAIPRVTVEYKGPILAVHFREVEPARVGDVEQAWQRILSRHHSRLVTLRGHFALEARLRGKVDKGQAVSRIRRELPDGSLVFYFGDDVSDRDAFRELKGSGVSVEVGGGASSADFTLPDSGAVLEVLRRIGRTLESAR